MESEDIENLRLASSYQSMSDSLAYQELVAWLEQECKKAELLVAQVPVSDKDNWHLHFLSWQRLVEVTASIKNRVESFVEFKEVTEKEIKDDERSSSPISHSYDSALPGYARTRS